MLSTFRLSIATAWIAGLLLLLDGPQASAQFQPGAAPGMGPMRAGPAPIDASGTVEAIGRGMVQIKSVAGEPYILRLAENASILVSGTAKKDVLRPGTFIEFDADVDKRQSAVQGKVEKLLIFTFSPQRPLGAFPGGSGAPEAAAGDAFGPNPLAPNPEPAQPAPKTRRSPRSRRAAAEQDAGPPVERFQIVGRITGVDKTGKWTVYAPNAYFKPAIQFELADEPEIDLELTDPAALTLVRPGDKVQARGQQVGPNLVQVRDITVVLAEPFTTVQSEEPKEKPTRKTTRSSRRHHAEAAEEDKGEAEKAGDARGSRGAEKTRDREKPGDAEKADDGKKAGEAASGAEDAAAQEDKEHP
jgi:hypothetical protein